MTFKIFKNLRAKSSVLSTESPYIEETALESEHWYTSLLHSIFYHSMVVCLKNTY